MGQLKRKAEELPPAEQKKLAPQSVLDAAAAATPGECQIKGVNHLNNPDCPNPYESMYGDNWRAEIDKTSKMKKSMSIRTLWEQVMASTIEAFHGTKHEKTFRIYHDALSQLTAEDTKAWLKTKTHEGRTWFDIWITPVLDLNKDTAYEGRPVGNSPELQPLDCSLFSDLGHDLSRHVRMTKDLENDDPLKFSRSTPRRLARSLTRLWWHEADGVGGASYDRRTGGSPLSRRIIEDVTKCMGDHLLQIIDAKGAMVDGIGNRSGRRERPLGGHGGARTKKPAPAARWVHPDGMDAGMAKMRKSVQLGTTAGGGGGGGGDGGGGDDGGGVDDGGGGGDDDGGGGGGDDDGGGGGAAAAAEEEQSGSADDGGDDDDEDLW